MAVTTTVESYAEYMLEGGNIPGCIGGGEDYRTITKDTIIHEMLLIRGWAGDNISSACKLVNMTVVSVNTRIRNKSNGTAAVNDKYYATLYYGIYGGRVSETTFTCDETWAETSSSTVTKSNKSDYDNIGGQTMDLTSNMLPACNKYLGVQMRFTNDISLSTTTRRIYIDEVKLRAVRTRACYVTFTGEGVTATTTMYDYGSTPSYGSAPTRDGYKFVGWQSSADGNTYSDTLPTVWEQDVTFTAVWEKIVTYTVTAVAGEGGSVSGGGTYTYGATVTLTATPDTGYKFVKWSDGVTTATRTVTVTGNVSYTAEFQEMLYKLVVNDSRAGVVAEYDVRVGTDFVLENGFLNSAQVYYYLVYTGGTHWTYNFSHYAFAGFEDWNTIKANNSETFTGEQFDAPYYANTYGDLYNAFGYNKQNLVNHYANYGVNEGRKPVDPNGARGIYPDGATLNFPASEGETVTLLNQWGMPGKVTLPTPPTRDCYKFLGWYTASSGGTKAGNGGDIYQPTTQDTKLYAHWQAEPPVITDAELIYGGKTIAGTNKVPAGQSFIIKCKIS